MVYCTKCGAENANDAENCKSCGAPLHPPPYREYRHRRRSEEDVCFGGRGGATWGIIIGLFILIIGVSSLLGNAYAWLAWDKLWPLFIILVALMIIVNSVMRRW
jgi:uncharacterized membrane protein YvbJ